MIEETEYTSQDVGERGEKYRGIKQAETLIAAINELSDEIEALTKVIKETGYVPFAQILHEGE
jgi:hypothetical protein